jgi:hypothetical protein
MSDSALSVRYQAQSDIADHGYQTKCPSMELWHGRRWRHARKTSPLNARSRPQPQIAQAAMENMSGYQRPPLWTEEARLPFFRCFCPIQRTSNLTVGNSFIAEVGWCDATSPSSSGAWVRSPPTMYVKGEREDTLFALHGCLQKLNVKHFWHMEFTSKQLEIVLSYSKTCVSRVLRCMLKKIIGLHKTGAWSWRLNGANTVYAIQ